MAGLKFRLADDDRSANSIGIIPAAPDLITGFFLFDGDLKKAARNLVNVDSVARVIGSPELRAGHMRFTGMSAYVQTDIPETEEMSFMVVARTDANGAAAASQPTYVSNLGSGSVVPGVTAYGVSMYVNGAASIHQARTRYTDATNTATTSAGGSVASNNNQNWACYFSRLRKNRVEIRNLTTGGSGASNVDFQRVLSKGAMRIGSSYNSQYIAQSDIAAALMWNGYIADAAYLAQYAQVQELMAAAGISI